MNRFVFPLATVIRLGLRERGLPPVEGARRKNRVIAHSSLDTELTVLTQEQTVCSVLRVSDCTSLQLLSAASATMQDLHTRQLVLCKLRDSRAGFKWDFERHRSGGLQTLCQ